MDYAASIFGDRWSMLILRDLLFAGRRHFKDMLSAGEGIASNILTSRLKYLTDMGLLSRQPDPANRRQIVYGLTPMGLDLTPALVEIVLWSARHDQDTAMPKEFVARAKEDRAGLIDDIKAGRINPAAKTGQRK